MTIHELVKELHNVAKRVGGNVQVVLASDTEGNSYGSTRKGETVALGYDEQFYRQDLTMKEFCAQHYDHVKCVILYPSHDHLSSPEKEN